MNEDLTRAILEQDNARLQKELADTRALLTRPVSVKVNGPDSAALGRVVEYLPQLTYIATNLSMVASALQNGQGSASSLLGINNQLMRIADTLERAFPPDSKAEEEAS